MAEVVGGRFVAAGVVQCGAEGDSSQGEVCQREAGALAEASHRPGDEAGGGETEADGDG